MAKPKAVHIRVNEATNLYLHFSWNGRSEKIYTGRPDTPENRDWCQNWADLMQAEMKLKTFDIKKYRSQIGERRRRIVTSDTTVEQFSEIWIEHNKATAGEPKAEEYRGILKVSIFPYIGKIKLRELRPEHADELTNTLRQLRGRKDATMSPTRMNMILFNVMRSMLDLAYEREYLSKNPHSWFVRQREWEPDIDPLSFEEMLAFLDVLPEPRWVHYFTVAFGTGLRPSEQFALGWQHIDFKAKLLYIRQGFVKGRLMISKTKASKRDVDMLPHVEESLQAHRRAVEGKGQYVFSNTEGGPLHLDNLRNRVWNPTIELAGLRPRNPYQVRHSFASLMLSQGEDPAWVARMMGHSTTRMLYQRYSRFIRNRTRQDGGFYMKALRQAAKRVSDGNRP
jgi:integrase